MASRWSAHIGLRKSQTLRTVLLDGAARRRAFGAIGIDTGRADANQGPGGKLHGLQVVYRISRRGEYELWRQSLINGATHHFATGHELLTPRLSADGSMVAYRRLIDDGKANLIVLRSADNAMERPLTSPIASFMTPSDWSRDGEWILGSCERGSSGLRGLCLWPVAAAPTAETQMRVIATDPERDLYQGRFSPDQ